jgi:sirohydrochlorin cobaltochelatase
VLWATAWNVSGENFSDAALVLIGHGSSVDEDSSAAVRQHAAELRRHPCFAEVREAFWKQEPQVKEVVANLKQARVFIVPVFISEGYFSDEVIPRELGFGPEAPATARVQRFGAQTLFYCQAIGSHPKMSEVLLARAREVTEQFPFPRAPRPGETTLFIAGHGTEKNQNSRQAIEFQAERLRPLCLYAAVHAIFIEEHPRIADCYEMAQTKNIIVVPFLISDGLHARKDIPVMLGEAERIVEQRLKTGQPAWRNPTEKKGKRVWYSAAAGSAPLISEVILDRVREAAGRRAC